MKSDYKVWFVDDLPKNLRDFEANHATDFNIETFAKTSEVLSRIRRREYPDALLIDVFFYETAERAQEVENEVTELAKQLKDAAAKLGLMDSQIRRRHNADGEHL